MNKVLLLFLSRYTYFYEEGAIYNRIIGCSIIIQLRIYELIYKKFIRSKKKIIHWVNKDDLHC